MIWQKSALPKRNYNSLKYGFRLVRLINIKLNLSCIQYKSLPGRSVMLARAVAKLYQLTSVLSSVVGSVCLQHWFLCHDVIVCFFLLWLHDRNTFSWCHNVYAWRQMYNNKQSWILKSWNLDMAIYSASQPLSTNFVPCCIIDLVWCVFFVFINILQGSFSGTGEIISPVLVKQPRRIYTRIHNDSIS